jgi:hypothetical protein
MKSGERSTFLSGAGSVVVVVDVVVEVVGSVVVEVDVVVVEVVGSVVIEVDVVVLVESDTFGSVFERSEPMVNM